MVPTSQNFEKLVQSAMALGLVICTILFGCLWQKESYRLNLLNACLITGMACSFCFLSFQIYQQARIRIDTFSTMQMLVQHSHAQTQEHMKRTGILAENTAKVLGLNRKMRERVRRAAMFHDIGKIAVDEKILDKPSKLTNEEYTSVKRHSEIGADILSKITYFKDCEIHKWVLAHHERMDGSGYPNRLQPLQIPVPSRIIAVVDSFDAMTDEQSENGRAYRVAKSHEEAYQELLQCSGTQFDHQIVLAFVNGQNS